MRLTPEQLEAAVHAAEEVADTDNVGTYGEGGVVDYYEVTNWEEIVQAIIDMVVLEDDGKLVFGIAHNITIHEIGDLRPGGNSTWVWRCACGQSGFGLATEDDAQEEADEHLT